MSTHKHHWDRELTKNQAKVVEVLQETASPLSAYAILDELRSEGFRAPLQVYRALEKLIEFGLVHRLESANAFVACQHPNCNDHAVTAFAICEKCDFVREVSDDSLAQNLQEIAANSSFTLTRSVVELRGLCRECEG